MKTTDIPRRTLYSETNKRILSYKCMSVYIFTFNRMLVKTTDYTVNSYTVGYRGNFAVLKKSSWSVPTQCMHASKQWIKLQAHRDFRYWNLNYFLGKHTRDSRNGSTLRYSKILQIQKSKKTLAIHNMFVAICGSLIMWNVKFRQILHLHINPWTLHDFATSIIIEHLLHITSFNIILSFILIQIQRHCKLQ